MILLLSGPPGAGKSSVAAEIAAHAAYPLVAHIRTDDFYHYIQKGYIPPWEKSADAQNTVVAKVMAACAVQYGQGGYMVLVDGVVGPWHLAPWLEAAGDGADIHYIVLRPDKQTAVARAVARTANDELTDTAAVEHMWTQFAALGAYEAHALDTTGQTVQESADAVERLLRGGLLRITK